jgi:iron complex outermembrane receptor protein
LLLSEGLNIVPGLQVRTGRTSRRTNESPSAASARSTSACALRIYVDGIPATLPDRGQTSNIDIGSLDRVEVLRILSALYGSSSGGVIQSFTETGEGPPTLGSRLPAAAAMRIGSQVSGSCGRLPAGRPLRTDGYRDHRGRRHRQRLLDGLQPGGWQPAP